MIEQPSTHITYHIKDASCFWSIHDDSINVYDPCTDDTISINGVDADSAFMMCRNMMCSFKPMFSELKADEHQIKYAKEMLTALGNFVAGHTPKEEPMPMN